MEKKCFGVCCFCVLGEKKNSKKRLPCWTLLHLEMLFSTRDQQRITDFKGVIMINEWKGNSVLNKQDGEEEKRKHV